MMATIAYLLTTAGDTDATGQRSVIQGYAEKKDLRIDNYITVETPSVRDERRRRIEELFSNVNRWDMVIVSDLACMGYNIAEIVIIIRSFTERGVRFVAARQEVDINGRGDISSKASAAAFDILYELEKEFASARIKKALKLRKKEGATPGRPKGSTSPSKLDSSKELIVDYLEKGVSKTSLARILGTSPSNLLSYLRTRKIAVPKKKIIPGTSAMRDAALPEKPARAARAGNTGSSNGPRPEVTAHRLTINRLDETHDVILCRHCGKNMLDPRTTTCAGGYIDYRDGESFPRIPYPKDEQGRCPKCSVQPGGFHHDGCYIERCPRCGERLVSCACGRQDGGSGGQIYS